MGAQGLGSMQPPSSIIGTTTAAALAPPPVLHDASHRHPVFFTTNLRRPAFALASQASPRLNPVAHGYLYRDGPRPDEKVAGPRL